jgi:hypothetical protein
VDTCGRPSGMFPQCGRIADDCRECFHNVDGLRTTVGNASTIWTACRQPSGMFPQCGRIADDRRECFHNVDGLRTTVGNVSTMWTACRRPSGMFPQCGRLADDCREHFFRHVYCINNFGAKVLPPNITGDTMFVVFFGMMNWELKIEN